MKKLLAAVIAAWACSSAAQDVTGNLIYTNFNQPPPGTVYSWSGFINTESGGGGLSGGQVPAYNAYLGQFMWGYMPGTINYSMAVNSALQGTGLRITGIQYGLEYWNQDLSRGSLSTTVTLRGTSGNVLQSYYHTLGYTTEGWTKFDMTKTFSTPCSLSSVGTLELSATGQDDRFWAGYYGPQIRNPYATLSYGVDPCDTNPLSSSSCPGFAAEMAKLTPTTTTAIVEPVVTSTAVSVEPVATTQPAVVEITPTIAAAIPTTTAVTTTNPVASVAPTATRSATANNSAAVAVAQRAVAETQATVNSVLAQAQESAAASSNTDNSNSNNDSTGGSIGGSSTLGSGLTISFGFQMPGAFVLPGTALTLGSSAANTQSQTLVSTESSASAGYPGPAAVSTDNTTAETSPTSTRALAAMSSPQIAGQEENTAPAGASTVRNVAPPSELAGGPDIGAMAVAPQGFSAYLTAQIRDAAFYPPREVYRGQRNVDNARALRGLGSDARHQEMVDQQYRK